MVEGVSEQKEEFLKYNYKILNQDKKFLFLLFVGLFVVYSFLFGLWRIPVIDFGIERLSEVGIWDYLFLLGTAALLSIFVVLWRYERKSHAKSMASVGVAGGGASAVLAGVCPVCQGIGLVAFGSTLLSIPTAFLTSYLGIFKTISIGLLVLGVYLKAESVHTKSCIACSTPSAEDKKENKKELLLFRNDYVLGGIIIVALLLLFNQIMIPKAFAVASNGGGAVSLGSFEYGSKITLKPMPLATGEQPKIAEYRSVVKPLPTISELSITPSTGDAVQDLLNNVVPKGTPWYGEQAGVSFDDPVAAQNRWGGYENGIQLDSTQQERWDRIVISFTCDYCCGSPQNPTIITRCGCAHAKGARGMAKWFIKYYGDSYSDEEIYGEMARWYALWYPKGTIQRIILEAE